MAEYTDDELREFDELTREEAEARGEEYVSPFDVAANAAAPDTGDDTGAAPLAFGEIPPTRRPSKKKTGGKRGRPRKDRSAPGDKGAQRAPRATSAKVEGPPPPAAAAAAPAAPRPAGIPAAQLAPLVKRLDSIIAARVGTEPLSDAEAMDGAAVLGPVLDHYLPAVLNSHQPWVPAALWVAMTYGPRVLDRAPTPAQLSRTIRETEEAHPASHPAAGFSTAPVDAGAMGSRDSVPPADAPAPPGALWVNPMENQPVARYP